MTTEKDYKQDILNTRKGCLGGSDAKLLMQVDGLGFVPKSAYKRLAVCKGLIEQKNITTRAMEYGDFIEQSVYNHLISVDDRYESNPCLVSKKYSRKNVKIIDHVDFLLRDDEKRTLFLYECKASKFDTARVRNDYAAQLYHHFLLGQEIANELKYKTKVVLVHYNMDGVDINAPFEFDPQRLKLIPVRFGSNKLFDMDRAVDIIDSFLDTYDAYYEDDNIDADMLPVNVKAQFEEITLVLKEIKERESRVEDFKKRLYDFMLEKNIKSIKNDMFSIVRVDATESTSFDYKAFLDEYASKHPRLAQRLRKTYEKRTKRKGAVQIRLKKDS
jgi:hypothetical protein